MLYLIVQIAIVSLPFAALILPLRGLPARRFWTAIAAQFVLMVGWAVLGGAVIGKIWWELSGGCAGNGGGFEGTCGYAGIAQTATVGFVTAVVMTTICGIALRRLIDRRGVS
ncbi:hypothetical protein EU805_13555 [Salipiger sp. IMCC34102]|uniref:hypothetical protein n=1 Tax=Salipiger sp. IMCC34102 TaxID=2510647 RepID=UPI00101BFA85|nr:hypothetical protein [Salipiger sp. IMCC34102]RYH01676.1 hypothetical protein EU805_13555 [Salipiger sp. IMCC34102]